MIESWMLQGGAFTALIVVLLLIAYGRLWTQNAINRLTKRYEDEIAELKAQRDMWHAAHDRRQEENAVTVKQVERLLVVTEAHERLLIGIKEAVK